jgi:hypothetical protein
MGANRGNLGDFYEGEVRQNGCPTDGGQGEEEVFRWRVKEAVALRGGFAVD